ncbi:MAG TPA: hypothetical protein VFY93_18730 [Planctomycetota bacterium]|nr:hypothetical protein [Planctomycetota bacterium]
MRLLFLLLLSIPNGPFVRWIDEKGDVHVDLVREVLEESPAEVRVRLVDGSERTVRMARVIDMVRENEENKEEGELLAARLDVAARLRPDAARKTLDRLAKDGSQPWIREYAAAARALLAEAQQEEGAADRIQEFLKECPQSRFQSDCILAAARIRGRAHGSQMIKSTGELRAAHDRIAEIDGPLMLRFRTLRDGTELVIPYQPINYTYFFGPTYEGLAKETGDGKDYGAYILLEAQAKWGLLLAELRNAKEEESKGRMPYGPLQEVKKLRDEANLALPEVRSDLERELGNLMLACGDKEGARGAYERARDLAPDPRRREAAEEALKKLAP